MSFARLVFDFRRAGTLGTRGGAPAERTLLFRAGNISVDLILPDQAASDAFQVQLGRSGSLVATDDMGQFAVLNCEIPRTR